MTEATLLEPRAFARTDAGSDGASSEAAEVSRLLACAGVDHASALWFQLLELATQQASDWIERSAACGAPLSPRGAAILGLRALASEILAASPGQADDARGAAEACLNICAEDQLQTGRLPVRHRRWGEGAEPPSPPRPGPLQHSIGCC
jgi:hypothetical protein